MEVRERFPNQRGVLKRLNTSKVMMNNPPQIQVKCPCGKEFTTHDLGGFTRRLCEDCIRKALLEDAEREKTEAQMVADQVQRERITRAHIPLDWQKKTFETSDPKIHPMAFKSCFSYATQFKPGESSSLLIYSPIIGSGKTHLTTCVTNYLLYKRHINVRFEKARDVLLQLKRTFDRHYGESEEDVIQRLMTFQVLVLDDVGWDPPTEWTMATYWDIFDRRMEAHLPVIVTTNCLPEEGGQLEERIGRGAWPRLRSMCGSNIIHFQGKDLR